MKLAKGYSLVITFTVAIETRDIRLAQLTALSFPLRKAAHLHVASSKNCRANVSHSSAQLSAAQLSSTHSRELFSPQAAGWSPRTWAAVILDWKLMIKDRDADALPVASAL